MNTKQAQEKILQLVDDRGGSIQARGKLIPYLADQLRVDCHETWPALEHALGRLKEKGLVNVQVHGAVIRGVERINNDVDSDEATDTTPDAINQEGITMTTENDQVGGSASESASESAEAESVAFKDQPLHKRASYALTAFQHHADEDGFVFDAPSAKLLIDELKISKDEADRLNVILGKLGLRKTIARLKKHIINMSITEVTEEMIATLPVPSPKSEVAPAAPTDVTVPEEAKAESEVATSSPGTTRITSIAQLEARFLAVVERLEAEKEALKSEKAAEAARATAETERAGNLERELKKVRKETGQLVERVCGERDDAQKQLQLLRQVATQPLQISEETQKLLAHYEE